jgi:RNA recognition motif-containing protein
VSSRAQGGGSGERSGRGITNNGPFSTASDPADTANRNYDNSIFIGNVPFDANVHDVEDIFRGEFDIVRADIITNRGQLRGMATVEFGSRDDVRRAIDKYDRVPLLGRQIFVRQDYPPPGERRERRRRDEGEERFSDEAAPGTEVFIGNLPFSVTWQTLKDLTREAGDVVRADVKTDNWGRSRGFGTVVYRTPQEAAAAVAMFLGYRLEGRPLEARPGKGAGRERLRDDEGGRRADALNTEFTADAQGDGPRSATIFVGNLPWVTNVDDLFELFETIGQVVRAEVQYNHVGKPLGNAVVELALPELADLAIANLHGYNYGGRDLTISYVLRPYAQEDAAMEEAPEPQFEQAQPAGAAEAPAGAAEAPADAPAFSDAPAADAPVIAAADAPVIAAADAPVIAAADAPVIAAADAPVSAASEPVFAAETVPEAMESVAVATSEPQTTATVDEAVNGPQ